MKFGEIKEKTILMIFLNTPNFRGIFLKYILRAWAMLLYLQS
jgi:hypothetical protein